MLVQTPDIPRVFLVEPEHKTNLQFSLMGNGRSRHKVWLEQQRQRQAAQNEAAADESALDDAEAAEVKDEKKGGTSVRRSKESLALEFLQRKERNKLADHEGESAVNSAAAAVDSTVLRELESMQEELKEFKAMFSDLLISSKSDAAESGQAVASAQPMSIMQREKTISQREKRVVLLQKGFLVMQDTMERAVAADELRQNEFENIKAEVAVVQRAIDTPGTIAKAADIANKRRRAQAMLQKAQKLNKKNQAATEKLPASEAATKQKHGQLMSQAMLLPAFAALFGVVAALFLLPFLATPAPSPEGPAEPHELYDPDHELYWADGEDEYLEYEVTWEHNEPHQPAPVDAFADTDVLDPVTEPMREERRRDLPEAAPSTRQEWRSILDQLLDEPVHEPNGHAHNGFDIADGVSGQDLPKGRHSRD